VLDEALHEPPLAGCPITRAASDSESLQLNLIIPAARTTGGIAQELTHAVARPDTRASANIAALAGGH